MKKSVVYIDFETRSVVDLKKCGVTVYAKDPSTDVLCLAWKRHGYEFVHIWTPYSSNRTPEFMLEDPLIVAWNALFEYYIWNEVGIKKYGWPALPLSPYSILDAQAVALYNGYPAGLDAAATLILNRGKDERGKALINKLSKPRKDGTFIEYRDDPDTYLMMYNYCKKDVQLTYQITKMLDNRCLFPETEKAIWAQTQMMNIRGIPVDEHEVNACVAAIEREAKRQDSKTPIITEGALNSVKQIGKLKNWLATKGIITPSLNKAHIEEMLSTMELPVEVRELLRIRQRVGLSTNAKFKRAKQMVIDNRIHGAHMYYGAHTGRISGRGMQFQNLMRTVMTEREADLLFEVLKTGNVDILNILYGNDLLPKISNLIRALVKAPKGKKFICADFSSIEAVATPWIANEQDILSDIKAGLDQYKRMAAKMFDKLYEYVTKEERQAGKVSILACGFAGGYRALLSMAISMGLYPDIINDKNAKVYTDMFRRARPKLCLCWKNFGEAACKAVGRPGRMIKVKDTGPTITFYYLMNTLYMILPSGRELVYHDPRINLREAWKNEVQVKIRGRDVNMSGANFFQNAVQAVCRDLLMLAQLRLEKAGYPLILSVHDECMAEVDEQDKSKNLKDFISIMTMKPEWAKGMIIRADGWEGKRYKK